MVPVMAVERRERPNVEAMQPLHNWAAAYISHKAGPHSHKVVAVVIHKHPVLTAAVAVVTQDPLSVAVAVIHAPLQAAIAVAAEDRPAASTAAEEEEEDNIPVVLTLNFTVPVTYGDFFLH
jgi:hypothetical protein